MTIGIKRILAVPCCQAEKYKWCKDLAEIMAGDGKRYCIFHVPQEHKGDSPESYNELVYKRIQEAIDNNTKCDLRGTIFPWPIDFSQFNKDNPFPAISFARHLSRFSVPSLNSISVSTWITGPSLYPITGDQASQLPPSSKETAYSIEFESTPDVVSSMVIPTKTSSEEDTLELSGNASVKTTL